MNNTEKQLVEGIVNKKFNTLNIHGHYFPITTATLGTVIRASEELQGLTIPLNNEDINVLIEALKNAQQANILGNLIAILILGAKREKENLKIKIRKFPLFPFLYRKISEKEFLAKTIVDEVSPSLLQAIITQRLVDLELVSFYGTIKSLSINNILEPTKPNDE